MRNISSEDATQGLILPTQHVYWCFIKMTVRCFIEYGGVCFAGMSELPYEDTGTDTV
jgi:hypothetical protein